MAGDLVRRDHRRIAQQRLRSPMTGTHVFSARKGRMTIRLGSREAAPECDMPTIDDVQSLDRLVPLVYDELRQIAHRHLRRRDSGDDATLATTALVNEVYLKLADQSGGRWVDRAHFLALASVAMRHILIDRARARL